MAAALPRPASSPARNLSNNNTSSTRKPPIVSPHGRDEMTSQFLTFEEVRMKKRRRLGDKKIFPRGRVALNYSCLEKGNSTGDFSSCD